MKNIIVLVLVTSFFIGCAEKEVKTHINNTASGIGDGVKNVVKGVNDVVNNDGTN